jgi:hypothetical protein
MKKVVLFGITLMGLWVFAACTSSGAAKDNIVIPPPNYGGVIHTTAQRQTAPAVQDTPAVETTTDIEPEEPVEIEVPVLSVTGSRSVALDPIHIQSYTLSLGDAGNIEGTIECDDTLTVIIAYSGSVTITGSARKLVVEVRGSGSFYGANFFAKEASVTASGAGRATVQVSDSLNAVVSESGCITYYGNPAKVTENKVGAGIIQKK